MDAVGPCLRRHPGFLLPWGVEHGSAVHRPYPLGRAGVRSFPYILMRNRPDRTGQPSSPPRPHSLTTLWLRLLIGSAVAALFVVASCWADRKFACFQAVGVTGLYLLITGACLAGITGLTLSVGIGDSPKLQHLAIRYRSLHGWIGILTGSLLSISFLAGTLTLFAAPLQQWSQPSLPAHSTIPLTDIPVVLDELLGTEHDRTAAPSAGLHYRLILRTPDTASLSFPMGPDLPLGLPAPHILVSRTGPQETSLYQLTPSPVPTFIGGLHRRLGLPLPENRAMPFVGIICFLYGLALFSGVILLLPGMWRTLMTVRLQGHARRLWLDLHSLLGLCSLPFHLIIALTTTLFAFSPLLHSFSTGMGSDAITHRAIQTTPPISSLLPPDRALMYLHEMAPEFHPLMLDYVLSPHATDSHAERLSLHAPLYNANGDQSLPPTAQPYLLAEGTDPHNPLIGRDRGAVLLDPHTGSLIDNQNLPSQQTPARRTLTWFLALHFGSFGGEFVRWLYVALGLCGVGFFHTANQLWLNTHRRKSPGQTAPIDTPATLWLGRLSEGTLLGCLLGICGLIAVSPLMTDLIPVTHLSGLTPPDMERTYQYISISYYGIMALTLISYCLFPRQLCRGTTLTLAALCLSGAVTIVALRHTALQSSLSAELTIAFSIASLALWAVALHTFRFWKREGLDSR